MTRLKSPPQCLHSGGRHRGVSCERDEKSRAVAQGVGAGRNASVVAVGCGHLMCAGLVTARLLSCYEIITPRKYQHVVRESQGRTPLALPGLAALFFDSCLSACGWAMELAKRTHALSQMAPLRLLRNASPDAAAENSSVGSVTRGGASVDGLLGKGGPFTLHI